VPKVVRVPVTEAGQGGGYQGRAIMAIVVEREVGLR
jgi:hypothetical protein